MNTGNSSSNRRPSGSRPTAKRQVTMDSKTDQPIRRQGVTDSNRPPSSGRPNAQPSPSHPAARPTAATQQRTDVRDKSKPDAPASLYAKNGAKPRGSTSANSSSVAKRKTPHPVSSRSATASKTKKPRDVKAAGRDDDRGGSTLITSLLKAVIYIVTILVVSGFLAYYAINIGNDVFAFVKDTEEVQLSITEDTDLEALSAMLTESGIIRYPKIFRYYIDFRYDKIPEFVPGDYTVSPSMSYDKLVATFAKSEKKEKVTVIVSIPEGYTVAQIIDTLVNKYGLSSEEALTDAIQNADFDYWFIDELEKEAAQKPFRFEKRKYRLEGYLYPDTYYYYSDATAETIINKMLKNFDTKMKNTFKNCLAEGNTYQEKILNLCAEKGRTFDEIVTLASMVQMEAKFDIEYGDISSVFHNRLNNPSKTNGKLESDATIQYFLDKRNPDLGKEELGIDDPYNTYLYQGLPPSAITNPTFLTINYALYPAKTSYYYFVAKPDGFSLFAKTYAEHENNIKEIDEMMKDS